MNMYCSKCGHPVDEETGFCPACEEELLIEARRYLEPVEDGSGSSHDELFEIKGDGVSEEPRPEMPKTPIEAKGPRPPGAAADLPARKSKRILPIVLALIICAVGGLGIFWYFGGDGADSQEEPKLTTTTTEPPHSTAEEPVESSFAMDDRDLVYYEHGSDSDYIKTHKKKKYYSNQLIIEGNGRELVSRVAVELAGQGASATMGGATLADARVVGVNDFDGTALLRWEVGLTMDQMDRLREEIMSHQYVDDVRINYVIEDVAADPEDTDKDKWDLRATNSDDLYRYTAGNLKESARVGYIGPSWERDETVNKLAEISPRVTTVDPQIRIDSLYTLAYAMTKMIVTKDPQESCDVILYSMPSGPGKAISKTLLALDRRLGEAGFGDSGETPRRTLICYSYRRLDDSVFGGMDHIDGISTGDVERVYDTKVKLGEGVSAMDCDVLSPSLAIVAGFGADLMATNRERTAKEARNMLIDSAVTKVEGSDMKRMIDGNELKNVMEEAEKEQETEYHTLEDTDQ